MANPHQPDLCYYCGDPASTDEHVPPKNLFPQGSREGLITVRSCAAHNNDHSETDEHFRLHLQGASSSEIAIAMFRDKTLRGLKRSKKFLTSVAGTSAQATFDGQPSIAIRIPNEEHDAYFDKIARGLHYHTLGERFVGDVCAACTHFSDLGGNVPDLIALYRKLEPHLKKGATKQPQVFDYELGRFDDSYFAKLVFYGDITVFCLGTPTQATVQPLTKS